jgi:uncharacterized RDD family membrane protein YckC
LIILFISYFFFFYVSYFGHDNNEGGKTVDGLLALPVFAVWFIYVVVVEAVNGATLGHAGVYLKVLTVDRKEIGLKQAFKRHLLDPIDILIYGIPASSQSKILTRIKDWVTCGRRQLLLIQRMQNNIF